MKVEVGTLYGNPDPGEILDDGSVVLHSWFEAGIGAFIHDLPENLREIVSEEIRAVYKDPKSTKHRRILHTGTFDQMAARIVAKAERRLAKEQS